MDQWCLIGDYDAQVLRNRFQESATWTIRRLMAQPQTKMDEAGVAFTSVGLFAGIGGIELGLSQAGHHCEMLCEYDQHAKLVLGRHFDCPIKGDIRELKRIPKADIVAAGFPCQDLSQAGLTKGISGSKSGIVSYVFPLLGTKRSGPKWLLIENVPFMLQLDRGKAMRYLVDSLNDLGFTWAYRVVDARAFGLPQRRRRVLLLASRSCDPRPILFGQNVEPREPDENAEANGFYWTEGTRGLGWASDAVPTIKGGSTIGIPSPPAIWLRTNNQIVTPDIRDAERLQGFPADWTRAVTDAGGRIGNRWKLVGNAVSVPLAKWLGSALANPPSDGKCSFTPLKASDAWPNAAWGSKRETYRVDVSEWPVKREYMPLHSFLKYPTKPLSERATAGFYSRALASSLRFPEGFLSAVESHLEVVRSERVLGS